MISNFFKIILFSFIFFYQNFLYSKNPDLLDFNKKNVSNYFSALVFFENNNNKDALKFFRSSKFLKESHQIYIKKYLVSLVLEGKVSEAINELKKIKNKELIKFFEADLLLIVDSVKNKNYENALLHVNNLKKYNVGNSFNDIIISVLEDYIYLFNNNKINTNKKNNYGNLDILNKAFQNCYLGSDKANLFFNEAINAEEDDNSRYLFFYVNYLINIDRIQEVKNIVKEINYLNSNLLTLQTKEWVDQNDFKKFKEIFSCKESKDLISEFFFLIANLYSSQDSFRKSNFYINISYYLNSKFTFNLTLLAQNKFDSEDYINSEKILLNFFDKNEIYNWFKIKKKTQIIKKKDSSETAFNYINKKFNSFDSPNLKIIFDMGNISKNFEKYELAIKYYSEILNKINPNTNIYAEVLYRRGSSYERLGKIKKSDEDLLGALKINEDDPYIMNYLAYSWLERNYKIDEAMIMLKKAYNQKKNDPYIIDSIGWAYYLIGDYIKAEKFLKQAVELMPDDPIVNDHYGDILWKLNRKIQANYFWNNVLSFKDTEIEMRNKIKIKLVKGLNKT